MIRHKADVKVTGQMLDKQATDRVNPPTGIVLQMRIVEINGLYNEVMRLMVDCPPELRLDDCNDMPSVRYVLFSPCYRPVLMDGNFCASTDISSMPEDWGSLASRQIEELFTDPKASRKVVKDGFLVQQANIYVTQVRYSFISTGSSDRFCSSGPIVRGQ